MAGKYDSQIVPVSDTNGKKCFDLSYSWLVSPFAGEMTVRKPLDILVIELVFGKWTMKIEPERQREHETCQTKRSHSEAQNRK